MGRRRSGEMPRVAVVKPHNHVRVRIGGRAYWLGKSANGRVTKDQQCEASKLWQQYLDGGIPDSQPLIERSLSKPKRKNYPKTSAEYWYEKANKLNRPKSRRRRGKRK